MTRREFKNAIFEGLMLLLVLLFLCMIPSELEGQEAPMGPVKVAGVDGGFFRFPVLYLPTFCLTGPPASLPGQAVIYCDPSTNTIKVSVNGGAFATLGGTTLPNPTDDNTIIGNGSSYVLAAIPLCTGAAQALRYDTATNSYSCGTISTTQAVKTEFAVVAPASQSGTTGQTMLLNAQSVPAAEWVAGAQFVFFETGKWINNDSSLAKTASTGIAIDGTARGSCPTGSLGIGVTGFATVRSTITIMTAGAGGTALLTTECISGTPASSVESTSITTFAIDTTASHSVAATVVTSATDTSSTGTNLLFFGTRTN